MDILEQCQKWHENEEYQKIIDALEAMPSEERTPEEDSEQDLSLRQRGGYRQGGAAAALLSQSLQLAACSLCQLYGIVLN